MDSLSPTSLSPADISFIQGFQDVLDRDIASGPRHQSKDPSRTDDNLFSQPAEVTVDDHIRLLRQYNKTKDVGQQLIGLVAESRGVALGTIYKEGEYGVCADD
ncbi:hypothetical protein N0V82_002033 [Gnomoniopsis sp. IMI 355080]|nr:hypothetical protein N0V82_002033 [Gnomoniopsis sp. IMI 355080]